jgi:hypothetical protein
MQLNLNEALKDHRSRIVTQVDPNFKPDPNVKDQVIPQVPLTVGDILETALVGGPWPKDDPDAAEKKLRFKIAVKIAKAEEVDGKKEVELSAAEVTSLKTVVNFAFPSAIVVTAVHYLLDPAGE